MSHDPNDPTTPNGTPPRRRACVLVVDDCPDVRDSQALLLRLWGHEVTTAADGPGALDSAAEFRPDTILLDLGLPGMDGLEVAAACGGT